MGTLREFLRAQKDFSAKFFAHSILSEEEKEEKTREFALALHAEASSLIQGINFKKHHRHKKEVSRDKILFEGIDVFRYLLAIMNVWQITDQEFVDAFWGKDNYLHMDHELSNNVWSGQPVVLVDLDDVLAEFRKGYGAYLINQHQIDVNFESEEYYWTKELKARSLNPSELFDRFVSQNGFRDLKIDCQTRDVINSLHAAGFWIHLLTARPEDNLVCRYNTYQWLSRSSLKFHKVSFSPEKFIWASRTEYYDQNKIVAAIDDSEKHCAEFAKHGIKVLCPAKTYNKSILQDTTGNVEVYTDPKQILRSKFIADKIQSQK